MFVSDMLKLLRRRRRWAACALLLLVVIAGLSFKTIPTTYQSSATVVLLPPVTSGAAGQNRFLSLGGLNQAVDVLVRDVTSTDVRAPLEKATAATFELTPDFTSDAPLLLVTVTGDRSASTELQDSLLKVIPRQLAQIQAEVDTPSRFQISALTVTRDQTPTALLKPKLRSLALVVVASAIGLLLLLAAADGLVRGRRRASARAGQAPVENGAPWESSESSESSGASAPAGRGATKEGRRRVPPRRPSEDQGVPVSRQS